MRKQVVHLSIVCGWLVGASPTTLAKEELAPRIKICSWNINHLSVDKPESALNDIAKIMHENACDVLSVQEVKTDRAENNPIVKLLGKLRAVPGSTYQWEALYSDLTGGESGQAEAYGLIWRKETLTYLDSGLLDSSRMTRKPHISGFRSTVPSERAFDFILIAVHTMTGSLLTHDMTELKADLGRLSTAVPGEPDLIVLGDFNLAPSDSSVSRWQATFSGMRWAFTDPPDSSMAGRVKLNDNFIWYPPTAPDFTGRKAFDDFSNRYDNGSTNKRISDHLLGWAEFWAALDNL